jgi:hypothetical protein
MGDLVDEVEGETRPLEVASARSPVTNQLRRPGPAALFATKVAISAPSVAEIDENVSANPTLGVRLLDVAVRLENFSAFPENQVDALAEATSDVRFARRVLARLVYRHMYLYRTNHRLQEKWKAKFQIRMNDMPSLQLRESFRRN